jgi:hypothetical protein
MTLGEAELAGRRDHTLLRAEGAPRNSPLMPVPL